jgi:hypothetical protein
MVQLKRRNQPIDNFRVGAFFNFESHRFTFAALCHLTVHNFQQIARFLFGIAGPRTAGK